LICVTETWRHFDGHPEYSLFTFESAAALSASDSAPVLQYGCGCSYKFLAKLLGVDDSSVGSVFAYATGGWVSVLSEVTFLITMCLMPLEAV
jgi:hypothetical protein